MHISKIGEKLSRVTGVRKIMNDIQKTLAEGEGNIINMSAGNPLVLPELEAFWKKETQELLNSEGFSDVIGRYGSTKGYEEFLTTMADFANTHYKREGKKWAEDNILVTTGSQSFYFFALNVFAGEMPDGTKKKVLLPQSPEYTGYGSMGLSEDMFLGIEPEYVLDKENKSYHYTVDVEKFPKNKDDVGVILLSRPCNPTGNVISVEELNKIYEYVEGTDIPVLLDSAYAPPIPNLAYGDFETSIHPNAIICLSFSKAGLPGERVGVAVGNTKFLQPVEAFESNACIMSSRFGQALISRALQGGKLEKIAAETINPYYRAKFDVLKKSLKRSVSDTIPYFLHETRGAMFGFMYFKDLPISDEELYEKLKEHGVLFVPGNSFFIGVNLDTCKHATQCLRLSITVTDEEIEKACKILGEVLDEVYK